VAGGQVLVWPPTANATPLSMPACPASARADPLASLAAVRGLRVLSGPASTKRAAPAAESAAAIIA